ncbi:unnamed protein product [Angiostrongylus costaricensis]|uniref:ABC transmembrane type-1 domain-containing protein n=1 Tax=Angiostrongylus costaricensis TaxID=334426 RepID=A0A0R3PW54_ANGCS|nr:unnamed protein product [Angiostrongylus costaricensis]
MCDTIGMIERAITLSGTNAFSTTLCGSFVSSISQFSIDQSTSFSNTVRTSFYGQNIIFAFPQCACYLRHVDSANILITILSHWDLNDKKVSQAAAEKTIQLLGSDLSCCALTLVYFGTYLSLNYGFVLNASHQTTLSVRQLGSLVASCAKLSYFDARVQRRLAKDLLVDVNNIDNWADVSSLVNSFSRLRFGDMMAWSALARWVNNHVDEAPLESLSIIVSGMARSGIEVHLHYYLTFLYCLTNSQNAWLSTVYSLAYFRALSPALSPGFKRCTYYTFGEILEFLIIYTRLLAINKWGGSVPRPIIFFGWGQTRQVWSF